MLCTNIVKIAEILNKWNLLKTYMYVKSTSLSVSIFA